jgi:hypothetical protein
MALCTLVALDLPADMTDPNEIVHHNIEMAGRFYQLDLDYSRSDILMIMSMLLMGWIKANPKTHFTALYKHLKKTGHPYSIAAEDTTHKEGFILSHPNFPKMKCKYELILVEGNKRKEMESKYSEKQTLSRLESAGCIQVVKGTAITMEDKPHEIAIQENRAIFGFETLATQGKLFYKLIKDLIRARVMFNATLSEMKYGEKTRLVNYQNKTLLSHIAFESIGGDPYQIKYVIVLPLL